MHNFQGTVENKYAKRNTDSGGLAHYVPKINKNSIGNWF